MLAIQKAVPLAKVARIGTSLRRKYPFEELEVGEMFFDPDHKKNKLTTHASATGKKLGRKFKTRLCYMVDCDGLWTLAEEGDEGAVLGVGVWRTK